MGILQPADAILVAAVFATSGWVYTARKSRTLARKQHTINILLNSSMSAMKISAQDTLRKYLDETHDFPQKDSDDYNSIIPDLRFLLNHYEFIAAGIRRGDIDEFLVLDTERRSILTAYEKTKHYIFALRNDRRSQSIYEHLEWLHARWESKPPGKIKCCCEWIKGSPIHGPRAKVTE